MRGTGFATCPIAKMKIRKENLPGFVLAKSSRPSQVRSGVLKSQNCKLLPCHGRGRGFESRRPRHSFQALVGLISSNRTAGRPELESGVYSVLHGLGSVAGSKQNATAGWRRPDRSARVAARKPREEQATRSLRNPSPAGGIYTENMASPFQTKPGRIDNPRLRN